jgi:hypothetical protein
MYISITHILFMDKWDLSVIIIFFFFILIIFYLLINDFKLYWECTKPYRIDKKRQIIEFIQ